MSGCREVPDAPGVNGASDSQERKTDESGSGKDHRIMRDDGDGYEYGDRAGDRDGKEQIFQEEYQTGRLDGLFRPAIMTAHGDRIDVAFGFFAIPLLIRRPPDFGLPAIPTGKGPINVELGQRTVGIDVFQLVLLGGNSARVIALLRGRQLRNAVGGAQIFCRGISTRIRFAGHRRLRSDSQSAATIPATIPAGDRHLDQA